MKSVALSEQEKTQRDAEQRAWDDWTDRVARDDADWGLYLDPAEKPKLSWWRRFLGIGPTDEEVEAARAAAEQARKASGGN